MHRHGVKRFWAPCLLVVALLGLAGCGEDGAARSAPEPEETTSEPTSDDESSEADPSDAESSPAPADAPECGEVWSEGTKIPRRYQGCTDESGAYVERDTLACSSGQRMVTFDDRYYGVLGGTVRVAGSSLDDDRDYRRAVRSCRA